MMILHSGQAFYIIHSLFFGFPFPYSFRSRVYSLPRRLATMLATPVGKKYVCNIGVKERTTPKLEV